MNAKELYLLSVKENGIGEERFSQLGDYEKNLLERRGNKYFLAPGHRQKFRVVLTGGVFDVLHIGHVLTLQKARELGDLLIAVVTTDSRVEKVKNRTPVHEAEYRRTMVCALKPVDLAIVGSDSDMMETFGRVKPDVVAFGYDQKPFPLPEGCKPVHLTEVMHDEKIAKTSRIIRELGL